MGQEIDIDDAAELTAIDQEGMLEALEGFPGQVREALDIGESDLTLPSSDDLNAVVVVGMGGSGISGDVSSAIAADRGLPLPVMTVKGYQLPPLVDERTLVFAVSYSGNTEETLDCFNQALERGARLVVVSSGGRLSELAGEHGVPCFKIPGGLQPRASLGYLFIPIVSTMERIGLLSGVTGELRAAAEMLDERSLEYRVGVPLDGNPTKRLARDLVGYLPVVYGSEGYVAVAAMRWKTQFNENAKIPSFHNSFSELNHNETVGWLNLADVCSRCQLVVLRQPGEHRRVEKRIRITMDLLQDSVGHITQVFARGSNSIERLLDLIYFGDYASVYLALALDQDPTPVTRIEELKKRLAAGPG